MRLIFHRPVRSQVLFHPCMNIGFLYKIALDWESPCVFSVSSASISGNNSQIKTLKINNVAFNVDKHSKWNSNSTAFKYQLFIELWLYNSSSNSISFNGRFVNLQLNLTRAV